MFGLTERKREYILLYANFSIHCTLFGADRLGKLATRDRHKKIPAALFLAMGSIAI